MSYRCQTCGQEHDGLPLDVGFAWPAAYLAIAEEQRASRCEATDDWCTIDGGRYFLRGCIYVRVPELDDSFAWGLWAEVSADTFRRSREIERADGRREPPHPARLSAEVKGYAGLDGHAAAVHFGDVQARPALVLLPSENLMFREQQSGITAHRVHEILQGLFPDGW